MSFAELMKELRHAPFNQAQWKQLAAGASALASDDEVQIREQLSSLRQSPGVLENIGALALYSNRPLVCRVLRDHFNLRIEDYCSTGGEPGVDATPGYPLLAHLAFMKETRMLERALSWGADPDATWHVERVMGQYEDTPETISWVGECIRSGEGKFLRRLLKQAAPPSIEEQGRRLVALDRLGARQSTTGSTNTAKPLFELFAPNGPYAMQRSFWDIPDEGKSRGEILAAACPQYNSAWIHHAHWPVRTQWLEQTAPLDGEAQCQVGLDIIQSNGRTGNFPKVIPQWCVDDLSDTQAQVLLEQALATSFVASRRHRTDWMGNKTTAVDALDAKMKHYDNLVQRLDGVQTLPDAPTRVLAAIPLDAFQEVATEDYQALAERWPKMLDPLDQHPVFFELIELSGLRQAARANKVNPDRAAITAIDARLKAIHEHLTLSLKTPKPTAALRTPRL